MKTLYENFTIISGKKFDELPTLAQFNSSETGARYAVFMSSANTAMFTAFRRKQQSVSDVTNERNALRQEFTLQFENASLEFKNFLNVLFTTGASFNIQLDGLKSKEYAECRRAENSDKVFFTPDYPIVPFGDTPTAPETFANDVYLTDGTTTVFLSNGFSVDRETGAVVFDHDIADNVRVFMRYTWRCPVRITAMTHTNVDNLAQYIYNINVTFSQTKEAMLPNYWEDTPVTPDPATPPTGLPPASSPPPTFQKFPD